MKLIGRFDSPVLRQDLFEDLWRDFDSGVSSIEKMSPAVDITEEKDKYVVKADLPGMKQDDIKVELNDGVLSICGERKHEKEANDEKKHYHYYERSYGSFARKFALPGDINPEGIKAKMENGVLSIEIAKAANKKSKEIKVE
ncbi:MAG: Hsp20/alpha crystallin family protein [Spirochaetia bacterium]|nr:Hsp20/alpha crystallin family protein [Spirochaetia bacterium]